MKRPTPSTRLLLAMLKTLDDLANDPMARIDSRKWHAYYTKRIRRLGIKVPPSPWREWEQ